MSESPFVRRRIAFILIKGFALMSFAAVTEPLRAANLLAGRRIYELSYFAGGAATPERLNSSSAASVAVRRLEEATEAFDLAFVVAGGDPVGFRETQVLRWLRRQARHGCTLGGVSGGPAVLANAGVMANRRMTLHWEHHAALTERHPGLLLERTLYVVDRDRMTCAGGTAPLDMMHALIAEHHGADFARKVSDWFMHTEVRPAGGPQRAGLAQRYRTNRHAVLAAIEAMENHIADPLPLADLARVVGVGVRQLNRQFPRRTGPQHRRLLSGAAPGKIPRTPAPDGLADPRHSDRHRLLRRCAFRDRLPEAVRATAVTPPSGVAPRALINIY